MFTNMNFLHHHQMSFRSSTSLKFDSNSSEETTKNNNLNLLQFAKLRALLVLSQNSAEP